MCEIFQSPYGFTQDQTYTFSLVKIDHNHSFGYSTRRLFWTVIFVELSGNTHTRVVSVLGVDTGRPGRSPPQLPQYLSLVFLSLEVVFPVTGRHPLPLGKKSRQRSMCKDSQSVETENLLWCQ